MAKLITSHEDVAHFHVIVGVVNLLIYLYRFQRLMSWDVNAGFGQDLALDVASLILMALPNLTSFVFVKHVPMENKGDNVTIWKEYRWHNAIYVLQSIYFLSIKIYQLHFGALDPTLVYHMTLGETIMRFIVVGAVTHYNPPKFTSTIRGAYKDAPAFVRFFLSYAQFLGTSTILCWEINVPFHFIIVAGLQINSFSMTLRKKGKIDTQTFLGIYVFLVSNLLIFGVVPELLTEPITSLFAVQLKPFYMGLFTFMLRRQGLSRYAVWPMGVLATEAAFSMLATA